MGRIVMKESPTSDFYVEWSSVVEAPTAWGSRAYMLRHLEGDAAARLDRADATGTSSLWVAASGLDDKYPEEGSWADDSFIYMQRGTLSRQGVFEAARRTEQGRDVDDLLTPFK